MIKLNKCPLCAHDTVVIRDNTGWYEPSISCWACGFMVSAKKMKDCRKVWNNIISTQTKTEIVIKIDGKSIIDGKLITDEMKDES